MDITRVLLKVLSWRFYRENSGFLLFSYVSVISYCFFIKTAGVYPPEQSVFYHLMLMMTFIVSPVVMLLVFVLFFFYTIKSWRYVIKQLKDETNQFLFYSFNASSKEKQFISLFFMQLVISLPLVGYWLFATILGVLFKANLIPLITLIYILILIIISALIYLYQLNKVQVPEKKSIVGKLTGHWKKPYPSLFLYYLGRKLQLSLTLTKLCSLLVIIGINNGFKEDVDDERIMGIIMLGVAITHSFIIYKDHHFKETYLGFSRNMPYHPLRIIVDFVIMFVFILLPELIWLLTTTNLEVAIKITLFSLSIALLFRSLVYLTGLQIYRYLIWTFCLFVLQFYTIMFDELWLLFAFNTVAGFTIFYTRYFRPNHTISYS